MRIIILIKQLKYQMKLLKAIRLKQIKNLQDSKIEIQKNKGVINAEMQ